MYSMNSSNTQEGIPDWLKTEPQAPSPSSDWQGTGAAASTAVDPQHSSVEMTATSAATSTDETTAPPPSAAAGETSAAAAAKQKTWSEYFRDTFRRDGRLLLITLVILIIMQIPFIHWLVYPFTIFSTWCHELSHGMAAIFVGGDIAKLEIFPDGSGLAHTSAPRGRGFIVSAGYQGTAVIGCLLLMVRRTKRGPRTGMMALAVSMLLSTLLWIRNLFGAIFIACMGLALAFAAWKLPSARMRDLYICVAVTTALNAITSVHNLFGSNFEVNGQKSSTDAHTMADLKGGAHWLWATLWLFLALFSAIVGILFCIPGPDEIADFTCCGVCQDLGCFHICNFPGQRLMQRMSQSNDNDDGNNDRNSTTTDEQTTV